MHRSKHPETTQQALVFMLEVVQLKIRQGDSSSATAQLQDNIIKALQLLPIINEAGRRLTLERLEKQYHTFLGVIEQDRKDMA